MNGAVLVSAIAAMKSDWAILRRKKMGSALIYHTVDESDPFVAQSGTLNG
jgi:hypothetical protein